MLRGYGKENSEGNPLRESEKQIWEVWILHDKDISWVILLSKTTESKGEKSLVYKHPLVNHLMKFFMRKWKNNNNFFDKIFNFS